MWILGIGDTGMANMLMKTSTRQVYIIDFDETTGRDKDRLNFILVDHLVKSINGTNI